MDYTIKLEQMEFRALHGCYELERKVGNRFAVDMELELELGDLAESDDLSRGVSYLRVYEIVAEQMKVTKHTIEAVALGIIRATKAEFAQIKTVRCTVSKLSPPLGGKLDRVSVTLEA